MIMLFIYGVEYKDEIIEYKHFGKDWSVEDGE
jgi:hypothetical protein